MSVDVATGHNKLDWARSHMPIHARLRTLYGESRPLAGLTVGVCSHLEAKTGVLIETLAAAGARVVFTGSEPMSTQDDVVAALDKQPGIEAFAAHGLNDAAFDARQLALIDEGPELILDDAAELTARMVDKRPDQLARLRGVCEQTTTGVHRLTAMAEQGLLTFPAYAVNDTPMKHFFDNVHGTGESALTNFALATNLLLAGKRVVVAGYGHCGRGVAHKAQGWGADVIVTEVDPRRALQAHMEGLRVMGMAQAAPLGDFFLTTTGNCDVIREEHFRAMQDGVVIANAGHFDVEIRLADLEAMAASQRTVRDGIGEYTLADGRRINVVAAGRLVNLAAPPSMGHPAEVMDQTFAMQFTAGLDLVVNGAPFGNAVHPVPDSIDRWVAEVKLATLGIDIDTMTDDQRAYLAAWQFETIKGQ
ncbi:MAG: adenosylhomocysteinase [Proteobacteria bacterium SW_6_67_9]|nr:MAG: adenosylhomocysteinase [Proteobacteria bacterium SW_6_67_9]